jgi:hypothetical protein
MKNWQIAVTGFSDMYCHVGKALYRLQLAIKLIILKYFMCKNRLVLSDLNGKNELIKTGLSMHLELWNETAGLCLVPNTLLVNLRPLINVV